MPIRYFVDLNCGARKQVGDKELLRLISRWNQADSIHRQFHDKFGLDDESKMRFREKMASPDGEMKKREISVAELRGECGVLMELKGECTQCPAAIDSSPYSCTQTIALPISEKAEQWLVKQIAPSGTRALELFIDACSRAGYGNIDIFANWRKAGFLEAKEMAKDERDGLLVTSDQVLHELFLVGDLMPPHLLGLLVHLQALGTTDGRSGDELLALMEGVTDTSSMEETPMIDYALMPDESDDDSVRELKQFLFVAFRAFSLELPLAVRL